MKFEGPKPNNPFAEREKQHEQAVKDFERLLEVFDDVAELGPSERGAIAFLVEDMRANGEFPEDLFRELKKLGKDGELSGLSWRVAEEIHERYLRRIEALKQEAASEDAAEALELFRQHLDGTFDLQKQAHEAGHVVPLGAVDAKHLPDWFKRWSLEKKG